MGPRKLTTGLLVIEAILRSGADIAEGCDGTEEAQRATRKENSPGMDGLVGNPVEFKSWQ